MELIFYHKNVVCMVDDDDDDDDGDDGLTRLYILFV